LMISSQRKHLVIEYRQCFEWESKDHLNNLKSHFSFGQLTNWGTRCFSKSVLWDSKYDRRIYSKMDKKRKAVKSGL
jgi:hypothetical protein